MAVDWTPLLWFAAVVVLIPLLLRLLKRTPLGGAAAHGAMRQIAALPLSASQRVAIVEVGSGDARRWLVLGVTAQAIHTLHTMAPQDPPPPAPGQAGDHGRSFAPLLRRLGRDA